MPRISTLGLLFSAICFSCCTWNSYTWSEDRPDPAMVHKANAALVAATNARNELRPLVQRYLINEKEYGYYSSIAEALSRSGHASSPLVESLLSRCKTLENRNVENKEQRDAIVAKSRWLEAAGYNLTKAGYVDPLDVLSKRNEGGEMATLALKTVSIDPKIQWLGDWESAYERIHRDRWLAKSSGVQLPDKPIKPPAGGTPVPASEPEAEEQAILPAGGRQDLPTVQGINEIPLASTAIKSGGYDQKSGTLQLTFPSGAIYQFFMVDAQVALQFFQAKSKGKYFNAVIRNGVNYKLISPAQGPPAPLAAEAEPKTIGEFLDLRKLKNDWGKLRIIAKDGTFLGTLEPNEFAADSIFNKFGQYGGEFSRTSIFNKWGQHGGTFSQGSPFNEFAINPPMVYYQGKAVFYLTCNTGLSPGLTVPEVLSVIPTP